MAAGTIHKGPEASKEKRSIDYLALEGIKSIFAQIDAAHGNGRRNLAMLALMYDSGARVQELIDLTPSSIRLEPPYIVKLMGKGRKERIALYRMNRSSC